MPGVTIYYAISHLSQLSALEVHKLYKLRVDVFVHEQNCAYAEIDDQDASDQTWHFQVWNDQKELLGTARLFLQDGADFARHAHLDAAPAAQIWQLGRICLRPDQRGTGLANQIINQTIQKALDEDATAPIGLLAQQPLVDYYCQYGFSPIGEPFDWDGMAHVPMLRPAGLDITAK